MMNRRPQIDGFMVNFCKKIHARLTFPSTNSVGSCCLHVIPFQPLPSVYDMIFLSWINVIPLFRDQPTLSVKRIPEDGRAGLYTHLEEGKNMKISHKIPWTWGYFSSIYNGWCIIFSSTILWFIPIIIPWFFSIPSLKIIVQGSHASIKALRMHHGSLKPGKTPHAVIAWFSITSKFNGICHITLW